jgi:hypothetical protein
MKLWNGIGKQSLARVISSYTPQVIFQNLDLQDQSSGCWDTIWIT